MQPRHCWDVRRRRGNIGLIYFGQKKHDALCTPMIKSCPVAFGVAFEEGLSGAAALALQDTCSEEGNRQTFHCKMRPRGLSRPRWRFGCSLRSRNMSPLRLQNAATWPLEAHGSPSAALQPSESVRRKVTNMSPMRLQNAATWPLEAHGSPSAARLRLQQPSESVRD